MVIANIGISVGSAMLGPLKSNLDWQYVILILIVFSLFMLFLIRHIHFDSHLIKVNHLEAIQLIADEQNELLNLIKIPV